MPIDPTHVGRTYPPTAPHTVTDDELRAFAEALGQAPDVYPPTFAMALAAPAWQQLFDDAELGLALARTMHADQAFHLERPFAPGDEVTATLRIEGVRPRTDQDWVSVVVDLDVAGETVATAASTFICGRAA